MKIRILLIAVIAAMLLGMVSVSTPIFAATPTPTVTQTTSAVITGKVLVWRASIRATDSTRSKRVAIVKYRTLVTILGRDKIGGWLKVQLPDGKTTGWIRTVFVQLKKGVVPTLPVVS